MAEDQRYCLECGERRAPVSEFLRSGPPTAAATPPAPPHVPPAAAGAGGSPRSSSTLSLLAGVGVLLIALGVGVLIGRGGSSRATTTPPEVVTVAGAGTGSAGAASGAETFTSDWPAGEKGYTVQLQTLPQSSTVSEVEKAKSAASSKGATAVGALKSEEFASLPAGSYIIYSGVYHKRAEAQKALGALAKKFSGAKVVEVSEAAKAGSGASGKTGAEGAGEAGSASKHVGGAEDVKALEHSKGKSYVEKTNNLPNVISTG